MISNDLGEGVDLADDRLARLRGCSASQITDECICFCHDVLREKLENNPAEPEYVMTRRGVGYYLAE